MILIFYDLETTGFSREHNDIIEIAGVAWDNETEEIVDTFSTYIHPTTKIPANITELTGISNEQVIGCPRYWEAAPKFWEWMIGLGGTKMVGYNNAVFDWQFLQAQNTRYGLKYRDFPQIDLLKEVRSLTKQGILPKLANARQPTIAAHFGITYDAHDAINDVSALVEIYKHLRKLDPMLP